MTPPNKIPVEELEQRAAVKPHWSDGPAYQRWWKACLILGRETFERKMDAHAVRCRRYRANKGMERMAV